MLQVIDQGSIPDKHLDYYSKFTSWYITCTTIWNPVRQYNMISLTEKEEGSTYPAIKTGVKTGEEGGVIISTGGGGLLAAV